MQVLFCLLALSLGADPAPQVFFCDPVNGSLSGDGSYSKPWGSFAELVAAKFINGLDRTSGKVHAGDTLVLLNGNHGSVVLTPQKAGNIQNSSPISVVPMPGHRPVINQLLMRNCANWTFKDLVFAPADPNAVPLEYFAMCSLQCDDLVFERNRIWTKEDLSDWTPADWLARAVYQSLMVNGNRVLVKDNLVKNVRFGITLNGDHVEATGNQVELFSEDGFRFQSSNTLIRGNRITDSYCLMDSANHNDGLQGFTGKDATGKEVPISNVVIDGNTVIASTGKYPWLPLIRSGAGNQCMQGIYAGDGTISNVTVTNNLVIIPAYNAIAFYGVNGLTISNNTVLTSCSATNIYAWISVQNRKDGTPSQNVTVKNNLAPKYNLIGPMLDVNNLVLLPIKGRETFDPSQFTLYAPLAAKFDVRLIPSSKVTAGALR